MKKDTFVIPKRPRRNIETIFILGIQEKKEFPSLIRNDSSIISAERTSVGHFIIRTLHKNKYEYEVFKVKLDVYTKQSCAIHTIKKKIK